VSTDIVLRSTDVPAAFAEQMHMATVLSESSLLPDHLRRQPANVLIVLMGARALDVPAFWALQSMHVIKGKLSQSAELMRALVIRAGHKISIVERSRTRAVIEIHRSDKDKPYRAEFTWQDAVTAELTGKDSYQQYPSAMLVARATAMAVRDECPDVLFGIIYTPDELGATTDESGAPVDPSKVVDGEVVTSPTAEEVAAWAAALVSRPVTELPVVWAEVVARKAQTMGSSAQVGETGPDTLLDILATRIGLESLDATHTDQIRELWKLAGVCGVLDAMVLDGNEQGWAKVPLRDYLATSAKALTEPAKDNADTDVVEGVIVEGDVDGSNPHAG